MSSLRVKYSLSDQWRFFRGSCNGAEASGFPDMTWEVVSLPHTVREEAADCSGGKNYLGECWYRRRIKLSLQRESQRAVLRVGGAKHISRLFMDGKLICEHIGGYLPFVCDVTKYLTDGAEHVLAIWMDNSDAQDIPPGKPQGELDFCYFGGLYRDVTLTVTELLHITDALEEGEVAGGGIFVQYSHVTKEQAMVHTRIHISNRSVNVRYPQIHVALVSHNGEIMAEGANEERCLESGCTCYQQITMLVRNPNLWHPDNPYLYSLVVTLSESGETTDIVSQKIGIRTIEFKDKGFFINGERLQLLGANRHQEYVHIGDALPDSLHREDARILKHCGFNIIRTGHYPQCEAFMDACDALGLLCIVPTPGWQWFRNNDIFLNRVYSDIRQMIRWHRNRPSVILWEPILNETSYSEDFSRKALEITHSEYPGSQCFAAADAGHPWTEYYDVAYPSPVRDGQPCFVREFGDLWLEQYGRKGTQYRCTRGQVGFYPGGETAMLNSVLQRAESTMQMVNDPELAGGALWAGIDTNRGYIDNIAAVGAVDLYRIPRFCAEFFRSQKQGWNRQAEPMVFIANWWQKNGDAVRDVCIFTNCDEVRLTLNGKEVSGGQPIQNLMKLPCPPILFSNIQFEYGELLAEGISNSEVSCRHSVCTPNKPVRIQLREETRNEPWVADGSDIAVIRVELVDEYGVIVPEDGREIEIMVNGAGRRVGENCPWTKTDKLTTEAGIATALIRSTNTPGIIDLIVCSEGLEGCTLSLTSVKSSAILLPTLPLVYPKIHPIYEADKQTLFSPGVAVGMDKSRQDIALHRPATATSELSGHPATLAVTADLFVCWKAASEVTEAIWEVDLQGIYEIHEYRIMWGSDRHHYTCRITGSADGQNYIEIAPTFVFSGQDLGTRTLAAIPVRYVRLEILDATGQISIYSFFAAGKFIED